MLFCGKINNFRVQMALDYLPDDIQETIKEKAAFTVLNCDAFRLTSIIHTYEEIIVLSPWIFPYKPFTENDNVFRYFIFCILHEVAHVILKHKSPLECSVQENLEQENDADNLALKWFNSHVSRVIDNRIFPLSIEEIRDQQELNQNKLASFLGCA